MDFEKIQTAANQVGVVIIAGGLVQGFFGNVGAISIRRLIGIGTFNSNFESSKRGMKNESSITGCHSRCGSADDYHADRSVS